MYFILIKFAIFFLLFCVFTLFQHKPDIEIHDFPLTHAIGIYVFTYTHSLFSKPLEEHYLHPTDSMAIRTAQEFFC